MVPVAPAWDNDRTSPAEPGASRGQQNAHVVARRERDIDLCYPALAARITQDAERLCNEQVSYVAGAPWFIQSHLKKLRFNVDLNFAACALQECSRRCPYCKGVVRGVRSRR